MSEKKSLVKSLWESDENIATKILLTPGTGMVDLNDKIREKTDIDLIEKYGEMKDRGDQWDASHPIGRVVKYVAIGTIKGLGGIFHKD